MQTPRYADVHGAGRVVSGTYTVPVSWLDIRSGRNADWGSAYGTERISQGGLSAAPGIRRRVGRAYLCFASAATPAHCSATGAPDTEVRTVADGASCAP